MRLIYTGVAVPDLAHVLEAMNEPQELLSMLDLRFHIAYRRTTSGEQAGDLLEQEPSAGVIAPLGTADSRA